MKVRSSVQAVIINENKILTIKKYDYNKFMNILPGGGQEPGETLKEAVVRECIEETGLKVQVGELLFVSEYIGKNHEHAKWDNQVHVVVHLFECPYPDDDNSFGQGSKLDSDQLSLEWLPLEDLPKTNLYPKAIIPFLIEYGLRNKKSITYVGDMG
ncbi:NUDIX domain-containing protein [Rummeliibacillus sp. NPDC094406]|uniref:NUDIX domain-containing protein n=1 Tax=Rummeliibacillus sp. NPDC094406 TaxID=3364511 RepID=UPI003803CD91